MKHLGPGEDKKESEKLGFDKEFTRQALERLLKQRDELQKEYGALADKNAGRGTTLRCSWSRNCLRA